MLFRCAPGTRREELIVKQNLIDQIVERLHKCEDSVLLDLILKLLLHSGY